VAVFAAVTLNLGLDAMFLQPGEDGTGQRREYRPLLHAGKGRGIVLDAGQIADAIQRDRSCSTNSVI